MQKIEIDFDVFKELTMRRKNEKMTYNDVLRKLLKLEESDKTNNNREESGDSFVSKGVVFPHGTKFRANYKGQIYKAEVDNGAIVYNNQRYTSPSSAAIAVTNTSVNGWLFWECKRPLEDNWTNIDQIRKTGSRFVDQ